MNPYVAEFFGTALLILFGNGVVANAVLAKSKGHGGGWIVITAGWAFGVMIAAYAVGRISGAHINPARGFGPRLAHAVLPIAGKGSSDWAYAWIPIVAPTLGGIAGAQLFRILL